MLSGRTVNLQEVESVVPLRLNFLLYLKQNKGNNMTKIKTTKTINYPVEAFKRMICEKCFDGKKVEIKFLIREVGGDPLDRFPGQKKVVSIDVVEAI